LDLDQLKRRLQLSPRHERLFKSLISVLKDGAFIESTGAEWRVTEAVSGSQLAPESIAALHQSIIAAHPELTGHVQLIVTCTEALPAVLRGAKAATEVMFPSGSLRLVEKIYK